MLTASVGAIHARSARKLQMNVCNWCCTNAKDTHDYRTFIRKTDIYILHEYVLLLVESTERCFDHLFTIFNKGLFDWKEPFLNRTKHTLQRQLLSLFFKTILFVCFPKAKPNPVPNFWVSKWNRYLQGVAIQMKVTEKYFPMVLFTMLYKVVRTVYETSRVRQFVWKLPNSNFLWYCLFCWARIFKLMILWMKKAWQFKRDLFSRAILLCCI